jgi:hypothetical protein
MLAHLFLLDLMLVPLLLLASLQFLATLIFLVSSLLLSSWLLLVPLLLLVPVTRETFKSLVATFHSFFTFIFLHTKHYRT